MNINEDNSNIYSLALMKRQKTAYHVTPQRKGYVTHDKYIYILIRYPAQTNIKHLSCNKQPQLGCVNTSRVRTKRTGNAEN